MLGSGEETKRRPKLWLGLLILCGALAHAGDDYLPPLDPHVPDGADMPTVAVSPLPSARNSPMNLPFLDGGVEEWPGRLGFELQKATVRIGNQVTTWIFDAIRDITLLRGNGERFAAKHSIHRRIFDNHDIAGTWTVIDFSRLETSLALYNWGLAANSFADTLTRSFGVSLGTSQGVELINIRQHRAGGEIPPPSPVALAPVTEPVPAQPEASSETSKDDEEAEASLAYFDPLRKAQFGRFFNMLTFPARFPLNADRVAKLEDGEIMSYSLTGAVQVGASVGWAGPMENAFRHVTGSLYASAYLRGEYRITILKEDATHVRVKMTRIGTVGRQYGLSGRTDNAELVEGLGVFNRAVNKRFILVPFQVVLDKAQGQAFDVGYRYDLTNPQAREAYRLAVLGRLAYSDALAIAAAPMPNQPDPQNTGVAKVFARDAKISSDTFLQAVNILSIFRHSRASTYTDWDAEITLPDGTRRVVSADSINAQDWRILFGPSESSNHAFRVSVDLDRAEQGHNDALFMTAEFTQEDSSTSGEELRNYCRIVEHDVGQTDLFPRLPVYGPREVPSREFAENEPAGDPNQRPALEYGRSSFYYRLTFRQPQLEQFIAFPNDRMWEMLERAFDMEPGTWSTPRMRFWAHLRSVTGHLANVPLWVVNQPLRDPGKLMHADGIQERWAKLKTLGDLSERSRELGHLFRDSMYSRELVKLLRLVIDTPIQYVASGATPAFGRIWRQGHVQTGSYPIIERVSREIDFDLRGPRPVGDVGAVISSLELKYLAQGTIQIELTLDPAPRAIFFHVAETEPVNHRQTKPVGEFIVHNRDGIFKPGLNAVVIGPDSAEPWRSIAEAFVPGKHYVVSAASTRDGQSWGGMVSTHFSYPAFEAATPY